MYRGINALIIFNEIAPPQSPDRPRENTSTHRG